MRWLLLMAGVSAMGCGSKCACSSTVSVALSDTEFSVFDEAEATVKLCLDTQCYDFDVAHLERDVTSKDRSFVLTITEKPARLVFVSNLIHGDQKRDVSLTISAGGTQRLSRTWPDTAFSFKEAPEKDECASVCVQTSLY